MKRALAVTAALVLLAGSAVADPIVDRVTRQLAAQGYDRIEVSRTFLGRLRFEAHGPGTEREIIINPRTGEILRDYWSSDTEDESELLLSHRPGSGVAPTDEGPDDPEEDDEDEADEADDHDGVDDEDEDDEDNEDDGDEDEDDGDEDEE